jgi:hypothetical protein
VSTTGRYPATADDRGSPRQAEVEEGWMTSRLDAKKCGEEHREALPRARFCALHCFIEIRSELRFSDGDDLSAYFSMSSSTSAGVVAASG